MSSNNTEPLFPDVKSISEKFSKRFGKRYDLSSLAVKDLKSWLDNLNVYFSQRDNFTTAIASFKNGAVYVGTAKRNPKDTHNPEIGRTVALTRAFEEVAAEFVNALGE